MQPGWYPDPYANGSLRWWDGLQWTAHAAQPPAAVGWGPATAPGDDLADEERSARWASTAMIANAILGVLGYVAFAVVFASIWDDVRDNLDRIDAGQPAKDDTFVQNWLVNLAGAPAVIAQIVIMLWLYRAASYARRCGLPARRKPFWAFLGFFVPIVNFWYPYQVARDCFHPNDPAGSAAGRWWAFYLIQTLAFIPLVIVAIFSLAAAVVLAIVLAVFPVLAAINGRRMVAAVLQAHRNLAR